MKRLEDLGIGFDSAICYSGYRCGQSPLDGTFPSYGQVLEDLRILGQQWHYLRIYDCSRHADLVLEAIRHEKLDFQVMLGADLAAEKSNPDCPWGADFPGPVLEANRAANDSHIHRLMELAREYADIVFAVSVGNEATAQWSDHQVPVNRLMDFVGRVRHGTNKPVTYCENHVPWVGKLESLAAELDFISVHTYPVWEYRTIEDALEYSRRNYESVALHYPEKAVIITEAGWTTASSGRGIEAWNASEELQAEYYGKLMEWCRREKVLTFFFEAFDEPWKGAPDPLEPEKHWGVFTVDRRPKRVMRELYSHLE